MVYVKEEGSRNSKVRVMIEHETGSDGLNHGSKDLYIEDELILIIILYCNTR